MWERIAGACGTCGRVGTQVRAGFIFGFPRERVCICAYLRDNQCRVCLIFSNMGECSIDHIIVFHIELVRGLSVTKPESHKLFNPRCVKIAIIILIITLRNDLCPFDRKSI